MGKVTSLNGKVNGKVGGVVYSIVAGQTIAREYNPVVSNPNTSLQVDARAKFKLISQLAAAMAPVIAIPKDGLVSSRNQFMKINKDLVFANSGVAQVTYENLQLTKSSKGITAFRATRSKGKLNIALTAAAPAGIARVVYIIYKKNSEHQLELFTSTIISVPGDGRTFPYERNDIDGELVIYMYGIRDNNSNASANYANYRVQSAEDIASLIYNRTMSASDYSLTQTRGITLAAASSQSSDVIEDGKARVYVTATGGGTATGSGVFDLNSQVTVTATPAEGNKFVGWRLQGQVNYISTEQTYTFTLTGQTDLVAVFAENNSGDEWSQN